MSRKFDNKTLTLDDLTFRVGVHNDNGVFTIKLHLPGAFKVAQVFRPNENDKTGYTNIVIDDA